MAPRLSVLTPTARYGGIDLSWLGLKNQTFKDFEWVIIDEIPREKEILDYCQDDRVRWLKAPPKKKGKFWNLDQSVNYATKRCRGELLVNLQDYIWLPDDALEKFVRAYDKINEFGAFDIALSGVGHKYTLNGLILYDPKGKITTFQTDIREVPLMWELFHEDPRVKGNGLHICNPVEWEANFSMLPIKLMYDLGGWDEDFDAGWGYDNVNLAERIVAHGGLCWMDEFNESYSLSHEKLFGQIDFKEDAPNNEDVWKSKNEAINKGEAIYLDYLKR